MSEFLIPINPEPKVRMTQRSKFTKRARECLEYQQAIAVASQYLRVPHFGKKDVIFGKLYFYRKGRRCDVDNLQKSLYDGMQFGGIFHNDNQIVGIDNLRIFYIPKDEEAKIVFSIYEA